MAKRRKKILENIKIEKIGFGGVGIANLEDGKVLLVSGGVLPGMIVDVKILKKKKDYLAGQLIKIKNPEDFLDLENVEKQLSEGKQEISLGNHKLCKHNFILSEFLKKEDDDQIGCGGCKWQVLDYEKQLKLKEQVVKDSFAGCDFFDKVYLGILPSERIYNYRNKMEFSFGKLIVSGLQDLRQDKQDLGQDKQDRKVKKVISDWSLGFHKQGQFSKVINVNSCLIAGNKINQVFAYLKKILKESGLPVYDNFDHSGFFRHLVIRQGFNTGEVLVNLSVATKFFDKNKDKITLWTKLQNQLMSDKFLKENVTTFVITENNGLADVVRGQDIKIYNLWGSGSIYEKLKISMSSDEKSGGDQMRKGIKTNSEPSLQSFSGNPVQNPANPDITNPANPDLNPEILFKISAFSFFQTNTLQAQNLFKQAIEFLPEIKGNVLDLYCGAGTIGLTLLKLGIGEKLLGVEIIEQAVADAKINAKINGLEDRAKFIADKAENINFEAENIGLVVIDPPRSGLHKNVVKFLTDLKQKIDFPLLYISCNPVTMARDLKMLQEAFEIKKLKAVDMFPHTHHIEMVGLLV